jgi:RsiW-degrading membrane proteinase PrsW (M82 family)
MDQFLILYLFFGISPSLIWLGYYMRKDAHPESKGMVSRVFLWGAVITIPTFLVQFSLAFLLNQSGIYGLGANVFYFFVIVAFTEETFKYLIVRRKIIKSPETDEPLDAMLYMVIGALGFAAVENIMYLMLPSYSMSFNDVLNRTVVLTIVRFLGSTFLHTLTSGLVGYFLALSFRETKRSIWYVISGLALATALHGAYDTSIMAAPGYLKLLLPAIILVILAVFVFYFFARLRKMKSICRTGNYPQASE